MQVPWLLAFMMIVLSGLVKMDVWGISQKGAKDKTVHEQAPQRIDINSASQHELEALPQIGPVLARRIIAARPFGRVEELEKVQGIGPALVKRLHSRIMVDAVLSTGSPQCK